MKLYEVLIIFYLLINIIAFVMYGIDKLLAVKQKTRIRERTLIFLAALGGGVGALCGMLVFHHKTRKMKFRIFVPFFLLLHVAAIIYFVFVK